MAESCKQQQEKIEESVLQPIDMWVTQQSQKCQDEPCNWWTLCLNKVFCWIVVALVKVSLWVVTLVVRYVYRLVCTLVMLVVGLIALIWGDTSIISMAIGDLWELIKDSIYAAIGTIIFVALRIVDLVQTAIGVQPAKRKLTKEERAVLYPIYRESLNYNAIELVVGSAGILTTSGAFTMGFTIYLPVYSVQTLVHESVHVWQFEFHGFSYIGNSSLNQLDQIAFNKGYDPYAWQGHIDAGDTWYTLKSAEAQAAFIEDVFASGFFHFSDPMMTDKTTPGAFFLEDDKLGQNMFVVGGTPYTKQANAAWRIIRTA
jgi:hypothetical protein